MYVGKDAVEEEPSYDFAGVQLLEIAVAYPLLPCVREELQGAGSQCASRMSSNDEERHDIVEGRAGARDLRNFKNLKTA